MSLGQSGVMMARWRGGIIELRPVSDRESSRTGHALWTTLIPGPPVSRLQDLLHETRGGGVHIRVGWSRPSLAAGTSSICTFPCGYP